MDESRPPATRQEARGRARRSLGGRCVPRRDPGLREPGAPREPRSRSAARRSGSPSSGTPSRSSVRGMAATVRIGTCSWADEALSKWFYPPKLPAKERLAWYAEHFDTVEVDSTYYRLPSESMVQGWAERTPDGLHDAHQGVRADDAPSGQGRGDPGGSARRRCRWTSAAASTARRASFAARSSAASSRRSSRCALRASSAGSSSSCRRTSSTRSRRSTTSSGRASSSAGTRCSSSSGTARGSTTRTARASLAFLERIGAGYVVVDAPRSDTAKNLVPTVRRDDVRDRVRPLPRPQPRDVEQARRLGGRALRLPLLRRGARRVGRAAARARGAVRAGVRLLQQQRLVGGSGQPARPRLAGRDERVPAAAAARREPDHGEGRDVGWHGEDPLGRPPRGRRQRALRARSSPGSATSSRSGASRRAARPRASGYDAVLVFGGSMHVDQEDRHPWLREESDWLGALIEAARSRSSASASARSSSRAPPARGSARLPEPEIGWRDVELTEAGAADPVLSALPRALRGARVAPLRARAAGRRDRARAATPRLCRGSASARLLGRPVPSRGDGAAARPLDRDRSEPPPDPSGCARRRASGSAVERARPPPLPRVPRRGRAPACRLRRFSSRSQRPSSTQGWNVLLRGIGGRRGGDGRALGARRRVVRTGRGGDVERARRGVDRTVAASAALETVYFFLLVGAYRLRELSVVYPVARVGAGARPARERGRARPARVGGRGGRASASSRSACCSCAASAQESRASPPRLTSVVKIAAYTLVDKDGSAIVASLPYLELVLIPSQR